jgi:predicted flap endonuclease-1-like 5' DNA nuclease
VSSIIFGITFLCLFLAATIGLCAGILVRGYTMPRYRPREGNDARTLRLMEVSAAEARREIAELRVTIDNLRTAVGDQAIGESLKKLTLLDAMWNKVSLLDGLSTRLVGVDERMVRLEEGIAHIAAQSPIPITVDTSSIPPPVMPNEDDLTAIKGIGPVLSRALRRIGVYTYEQIAAWGPSEVESYQARVGHGRAHIRRDEWVSQAQALLAKARG